MRIVLNRSKQCALRHDYTPGLNLILYSRSFILCPLLIGTKGSELSDKDSLHGFRVVSSNLNV